MKKKQRKKTNWSSIVLIAIVLVGLTVVVLANKKSEDKIIWEKISLQMIYPDKTATNDLVGDTLGRMNSFSTLLKGMAADRDTNLIRLLDSERAVAVSVEQLDADLKKLAGVRIDVIGQIHESMMGTESEKLLVKDIQGSIKKMVFDSYDVMWSEDFNDGLLINDSNCCELLFAEGRESDLPAMKMVNDIRLVTEQVQRSTPYHASYQFIFDKRSKIEVRGADYHRVKAIQQHLMTY